MALAWAEFGQTWPHLAKDWPMSARIDHLLAEARLQEQPLGNFGATSELFGCDEGDCPGRMESMSSAPGDFMIPAWIGFSRTGMTRTDQGRAEVAETFGPCRGLVNPLVKSLGPLAGHIRSKLVEPGQVGPPMARSMPQAGPSLAPEATLRQRVSNPRGSASRSLHASSQL